MSRSPNAKPHPADGVAAANVSVVTDRSPAGPTEADSALPPTPAGPEPPNSAPNGVVGSRNADDGVDGDALSVTTTASGNPVAPTTMVPVHDASAPRTVHVP